MLHIGPLKNVREITRIRIASIALLINILYDQGLISSASSCFLAHTLSCLITGILIQAHL